jgi:hypothetical protein
VLDEAKSRLIRVESRFRWLRNYQPVQAEFVRGLKQGNELFKLLEIEEQNTAVTARKKMAALRHWLQHLDQCSRMTEENRACRRSLTKAEVILNESQTLFQGGQVRAAEELYGGVRWVRRLPSSGPSTTKTLSPGR